MDRRHPLAAALCLAALALAPRPSAAAGLVARYTFDDCTAADSSGAGNQGTLVRPENATCVPGVSGSALAFQGVSSPGGPWAASYVTVPPSPSLAFVDDYAFTLWFNIHRYLSMDGYGAINDFGMHSLFAKSGDREGLLARTFRNPGEDHLNVLIHDGCFATGACNPELPGGLTTTAPILPGEWHMLSVTSGGGFVRVYLDGALQSEMPTALFEVNPTMPSKPLQLGVDQDAWWYPLDGTLDEVCVHARALSAAEVQAAFAARSCDVVPVTLDVRPLQTPNPINLSAKGVVPAAILGSATFDAATVAPATLVLAGAHVALLPGGAPQASLKDVDGDGLLDLLAHFPVAAMTLQVGDTVATLTGALQDGTAILGQDAVVVLR